MERQQVGVSGQQGVRARRHRESQEDLVMRVTTRGHDDRLRDIHGLAPREVLGEYRLPFVC